MPMVGGRRPYRETDAEAEHRQTVSLLALALVLLIVVLGLILVNTLRSMTQIEDCLLSGRTNCGKLLQMVPFP